MKKSKKEEDKVEVIDKTTPFTYVSIIRTKKGSWSEHDPKHYSPYIVNKALSFGMTTIFHANEMNKRSISVLPVKAQFDFYINSVSKQSGYSPWIKTTKQENVHHVKSFYDVSTEKAKEILTILSEDQIDYIRMKVLNREPKNE